MSDKFITANFIIVNKRKGWVFYKFDLADKYGNGGTINVAPHIWAQGNIGDTIILNMEYDYTSKKYEVESINSIVNN